MCCSLWALSPEEVQAFATAAEALRMPLKIVRDTRADERNKYDAELVLIRPDQFVAWVSRGEQIGEGPFDATAILSRVIGGTTSATMQGREHYAIGQPGGQVCMSLA